MKRKKLMLTSLLLLVVPEITHAAQYVVCGNDNKMPLLLAQLISTLMTIVKIFIPILLVISGMISFFKVTFSSNVEDEMKKAKNKLINNIIAAIIIFFVISIINFAVSLVVGANNNVMSCVYCLINPDKCEQIDQNGNKLCPGFIDQEYDENCNPINNNTESNEEAKLNEEKTIPGKTFSDGVKYYDASWVGENPVYYNPGNVETNESARKCTAGESGCLKWYAYSEFVQNGKTYVNLILEKNTTERVAWLSENDWNLPPENVGISYPEGQKFTGDQQGPLTVLNQLHADTDSWNIPLRRDAYTETYTEVCNSGIICDDTYNTQINHDTYTINYSRYTARLISVEEIIKIIDIATLPIEVYSRYNFSEDNEIKYAWLFDNLNKSDDNSWIGYWTVSNPLAGGKGAWTVMMDYSMAHSFYYSSTHNENCGVRPVITLLKSETL